MTQSLQPGDRWAETVGHPAGGDAPGVVLRPSVGLQLLGEYQGSGFTEPRYLLRRGDGQVIQVSRLLYLVVAAIVEGDTDGGWTVDQIAGRVSADFGREVTAHDVDYLTAGKLAPLGVLRTGTATPAVAERAGGPRPLPTTNPMLGLRIRGVLLRPRASAAVGDALAWLHYPPLVAAAAAGFFAFESWLFVGHGAISPLLDVLRRPALLLAVAGLTLVSMVWHEFGHASACRYGGARPGAIGFGLYLVWPSLYTDVTDAYRLNRSGRLRTDLGGVYFNAIFVLVMAGCYAATGQPVFLAAAFLDNFEILQQLVPVVRMDGYFILGDLAGIPDLLSLLGPIMARLLPGPAARRAAARARGLRREAQVIVTVWVLVALPLLAAVTGYTLWNAPAMMSTAIRSFTSGLAAVRAALASGHPMAGFAAGFSVALLVIPVAGLAYLAGRLATRGTVIVSGLVVRLGSRAVQAALAAVIAVKGGSRPVRTAATAALTFVALLVAGLSLAGLVTPVSPRHGSAALSQPSPRRLAGAAGDGGVENGPGPTPVTRNDRIPSSAPRLGHRTVGSSANTDRGASVGPAAGTVSPVRTASGRARADAPDAPGSQAERGADTVPAADHAHTTTPGDGTLGSAIPPNAAPASSPTATGTPSVASPGGGPSSSGGSASSAAGGNTPETGGSPASGHAPTPSPCAVQLGIAGLTIGVVCP